MCVCEKGKYYSYEGQWNILRKYMCIRMILCVCVCESQCITTHTHTHTQHTRACAQMDRLIEWTKESEREWQTDRLTERLKKWTSLFRSVGSIKTFGTDQATHTHTHTHIRTYTHTHTHTHIYIYIYIYTGWNDKIVVLKKTTLQIYF